MSFVWHNPLWFWGLLLLPLLLVLIFLLRSEPAAPYPALKWLKAWGNRRQVNHVRPDLWIICRFIALALIIIGLARPQEIERSEHIENPGRDILMVVDVSGSMIAHDFVLDGKRVDRLVVVQHVLRDFISRRSADRLGLLIFAVEPFLVSPLTLDHNWLNRNLDRLEIGMIDPNGTAIGTSLAVAVNRLRTSPPDSRVVILLTDGENNAGNISPLAAAQLAQSMGVRVHTVGVGIDGLVPVPQMRNGQIVRDRNGQPIFQQTRFEMDNETLEEMARITGGRFFSAVNTDELNEIYAAIDSLEATDIEVSVFANITELAPWLIGLALIVAMLEPIGRKVLTPRYP
jgi:Ca-activated chloride channel family protein